MELALIQSDNFVSLKGASERVADALSGQCVFGTHVREGIIRVVDHIRVIKVLQYRIQTSPVSVVGDSATVIALTGQISYGIEWDRLVLVYKYLQLLHGNEKVRFVKAWNRA